MDGQKPPHLTYLSLSVSKTADDLLLIRLTVIAAVRLDSTGVSIGTAGFLLLTGVIRSCRWPGSGPSAIEVT